MTNRKKWADCTPTRRAAYLRSINMFLGAPAKGRAEKFLDENNPTMLVHNGAIIVPADKRFSRQEFAKMVPGNELEPCSLYIGSLTDSEMAIFSTLSVGKAVKP